MIELPERQYCKCGSRTDARTFVEVPKPSWFPKCEASRVYVCRICNKVSHAVEELVVALRGPKDAMLLSVAGQVVNGVSVLRWRSSDTVVETIEFKPYPRNDRMHPSQTEPMLFTLWRRLDDRVSQVMNEPDNEYAKNTAQGMAEIIQVLMVNFYPTSRDVLKEAVKRHKARIAEEEHETPGLGEHLFNPHFNADGSERIRSVVKPEKKPVFAKPKAAPKSKGGISDSTLAGIKMALEMQLSEEQICKTFDVTPEQLKEVAK